MCYQCGQRPATLGIYCSESCRSLRIKKRRLKRLPCSLCKTDSFMIYVSNEHTDEDLLCKPCRDSSVYLCGTLLKYRRGCRCSSCTEIHATHRTCIECRKDFLYLRNSGKFCSIACKDLHLSEIIHGKYSSYLAGCRCGNCSAALAKYKNKGIRTKLCEVCSKEMKYSATTKRFCSNYCRVRAKTSKNYAECSKCGEPGNKTRRTAQEYMCTNCKNKNPVHGVSYYQRTRCRCTICVEDVNRRQREWNLRYYQKHGRLYSTNFNYIYFYVAYDIRMKIYERDEWKCQLCGYDYTVYNKDLPDRLRPTLDHIVCASWTDTPDHSPENLRLSCKSCNSSRSDAKDEKQEWELDRQKWENSNKKSSIDTL